MYCIIVASLHVLAVLAGQVKYAQLSPTTRARSLLVEETFAAGIPYSVQPNPLVLRFSPATNLANPRFALVGPADFTFICQDVSLVETAADMSTDAYLVTELACSTSGNVVYVNVTSIKPILTSSNYTLTVTSVNPQVLVAAYDGTDWSLLIRNSTNLVVDSDTSISGFFLTSPVVVFSMINTDGSYYGFQSVSDILGRLVLPAALVQGDLITIEAPSGFSLQSQSTSCTGFQWLTTGGVEYRLPGVDPSCAGALMQLVVGASGAVKNLEMRWTFDTVNPAVTPASNFWKVRISRGDSLLFSQVYAGWEVIPQLSEVQIESTGALKAATRVGAILLTFTAVSAADKVTLVDAGIVGFDFSKAIALLNSNEILDAFGNTISVRIVAREGEVCQVHLGNVKMGSSGGPTNFNITTYWGDEKRDEKTFFRDGFILPGLVTVLSSELITVQQEEPDEHPVTKDFLVPYAVDALGRLRVTFTQDVLTDSIIRVTLVGGFSAKAIDFAIFVAGVPVSTSNVQMVGGNQVLAKVNQALMKNTETVIEVACTTPATPSDVASAVAGSWRVESFRPSEDVDTALPSNTNDGLDAVQQLVVPMTFSIVPASCLTCGQQQPPGAHIAVSIDLRPNGALPHRIYIIAPPDFEFGSPSCLRAYTGTDIVSCAPMGKTVGNRPVAVLQTRAGGLQDAPSGLRITAITPQQNPSDERWQVRGVQVSGGVETEVGWGESAGFPVLQMSQTVLYYPNLPTAQLPDPLRTRVWMTMGFRTRALFDMRGGVLEVSMPTSFTVFCHTLATFKLPIDVTRKCSDTVDRLTNTLRLSIGFNDTMSATDYALAIAVQTPLATPRPPTNTFSLVLKDKNGDVKDAFFGIYALKVSFGYPILAPGQVYWEEDSYDAEGLLPTDLIVNFFTRIEFDVVKAFSGTEGVSRIRIDFQPGVALNKRQQTNTTGYGSFMSASLAERVSSLTMPTTSVMLLTISASKVVFPVGKYWISFPVTLPDATDLPAHQFYTITFCRATGTCLKGNGTGLILSHSIKGYQLTDIPPGNMNAVSGARAPTLFPLLFLILTVTLVLN